MDLTSILGEVLKGQAVDAISKKTGVDTGSAKSAISKALPLLLGGLEKNTESSEGAENLDKALGKHDGGILDNLSDGIDLEDGGKILGHIFGNKAEEVEKESGNPDVMKAVAPILMGALGKLKGSEGLSAGDLLDVVKGTKSKGDLLTSFLDRDGDGKYSDDLMDMGMDFMKNKFFSKK